MMKNSQNTKRALIFSITSIMICVLMLTGSTFAWFTDSSLSGKNMIKAGNLDIEFYHSNATTAKEKVDQNTLLFAVDYWEPGAIAYENFEIANVGDLALKYEFKMSIGNYNTVVDTGKSLKDVLKIAIHEGDAFTGTREDALKFTFDKTLADFEKEAILPYKGKASNFTVFVYWEPTENDNDYNLNNGRVSNDNNPLFIDLGVSLNASQSTYESDTFGTDYDDMTTYKDASTIEEVTTLIENCTKDEGIKLTNDITFENAIPQSKSGITKINLNGHTLTDATISNTIIENGHQMIIKNGKIKLEQNNYTNPVIKVSSGAAITLDNVELTVSDKGTALLLENIDSTANIISSTITSTGYAITTNASSKDHYGVIINIKDSTINGSKDGGGTPILINIPSTTTIEHSTINGYYHTIFARGGTMTIKDSTLNLTVGSYIEPWMTYYDDGKDWKSGDMAPIAALVIGNKGATTYQYPTNVKMTNTKITSQNDGTTTVVPPTVIINGNAGNGLGATLTYDDVSNIGEVVRGNEFVTVNGQ